MNKRRLVSSTGLTLAAILSVGIIILANATLTSYRLDLTQNKLFTLSQGTVNILHSLKEPISLDFYFSRQNLVDFPQLMNYAGRVRDLLQEYAALSDGKIKLTVIEPEPFSDAEDQAVASGLRGIATNSAGDRAYLGLVGTNSTDDEQTIPFFEPSREASLEYDITKLIYKLAHPSKNVVGVISSLPLFGSADAEGKSKPWAIVPAMKEFFDVKNLGTKVDHIEKDVNVLMVVHPKKLSDQTLYAIDQFLLGGGKAMIFVDPFAQSDKAKRNPNNPYAMPDISSNLQPLFKTWGIKLVKDKIAGDAKAAMRVRTRGPRGPGTASYLPWLKLDKANLDQKDFATSELQTINMATAGILEKDKGASIKFTPLIQTSKDSMMLNRDLILFQHDPNVIMDNFKSGDKRLVLAARLSGKVKSAYPKGPPPSGKDDKSKTADSGDSNGKQLKEGNLNVIVVADTDILANMFWTRNRSYFGVNVPQTIADNGKFVINSLQNLLGNTDLISLRSRGNYERPFVVVENIRRKAEQQFHEREEQLQAKLKQTEQKIAQLQKKGGGGNMILSPEEQKEIDQFRHERLKTRKQLREVQHDLQKDIEHLGTVLKFINIGLVPLLIALLAVAAGLYRHRKRV
jgi:ABC-type uncharacterized transport system involved in gliding motility auxiliary subunit